MAERRLIYLVALVACLVFYWAYREWLSWVLLMAVVFLPWFTLAVSLPAMLTCRLRISCPARIGIHTPARVNLTGNSRFPMPPVKGRLVVERPFTGHILKIKNGAPLPTEHCGRLQIRLTRAWCYDYLGLFRMRVRRCQNGSVLVQPETVVMENPPDITRYMVNAWRPKAGGGFAENHELRLYRPGDSLRQVHWKLSAKTGKLVYREPMEALRGLAVLTLILRGTPAELDKKLGTLQYLSAYLLGSQIPHRICCLTGSGVLQLDVANEGELSQAMDAILSSPPAPKESELGFIPAAWRYHVGGDGDEA